jgi:hypothetical protein
MFKKEVEGIINWIDLKNNIGNKSIKKKYTFFGITLFTTCEHTTHNMSNGTQNIGFIKNVKDELL